MAKICRLTEENNNGSGSLIRSSGFSVGCNCWVIFLLMITMDLDPSRRSRLHPDQRYILILLLFRYTISLFVNLTIPEDPLLYPNDWDQCYFLIMLFFVYLEVNSFISALCLSFPMIWCTGTAQGRIVIFQCALIAAVTKTLVGLFSSAAPNSFQVLCLFRVFI